MEEFKSIYKILAILHMSMDFEEWDKNLLSHESLNLSFPKWSRIMSMLLKEGYISGGETIESVEGFYPRVKLIRPEITLKGLEYLEENSLMKEAARLIQGGSSIVK